MDGRSGFATTLFKYNLNKSFIGIEWQYMMLVVAFEAMMKSRVWRGTEHGWSRKPASNDYTPANYETGGLQKKKEEKKTLTLPAAKRTDPIHSFIQSCLIIWLLNTMKWKWIKELVQ